MDRKLPTLTIEGTTFTIDVQREQLQQERNPDNVILFSDMVYKRDGYVFDYDRSIKSMADLYTHQYLTVHIPNMTELDPVGMAQKYNLSEAYLNGKADVDIVIDQSQLALREQGLLPVIEIVGHPFYVDLAMDSLRPKDDFTTTGIRFSDIDNYFDESTGSYRIPYNPKTHNFQEPDYDTIKAIPKGLVVVEIPLHQQLDPIAYARIHGFEKEQILREHGLQMQRIAKEIPWDETPIKQIIARNLKRDLEQKQQKPVTDKHRKRGRGI